MLAISDVVSSAIHLRDVLAEVGEFIHAAKLVELIVSVLL